RFGPESAADFRDIKVSNCVVRNSNVGIQFFIGYGGTAEQISFENLSIETIRPASPASRNFRSWVIPIDIALGKARTTSPIGHIRDVTLSNIQIVSDSSVLIQGAPGQPIEGLVLRDLIFRDDNGFDFALRTEREHDLYATGRKQLF